jgi:methionyl-tRNA formyltransferase
MTTAPLRSALFGSDSPLSLAAFDALAATTDMRVVVTSTRSPAIERRAKNAGCNVLHYGPEVAGKLSGLEIDLLVIAAFPRRLGDDVLRVPARGTINVHPSLLPRHRGPDPLFWTYFDGDATAGVTLHWATARFDAGPIIAQREINVPRGMPVAELYPRLASEAALLLREVCERLRSENIEGEPQDEARATTDRRPRPGAWRIDFDAWPVERLWHFLSGLGERRSDLLPVFHGRALRIERGEHAVRPGTIERNGAVLRVYARDGFVEVEKPSFTSRLRALLRRSRTGILRHIGPDA